jgi:hypothetical protein
VVNAEAFAREEDPENSSLEAMLAHERGHQLLVRQPKLRPLLQRGIRLASEEILASLIGSVIAEREQDREVLSSKALSEALARGMESAHALRLLHDLRGLLERAL